LIDSGVMIFEIRDFVLQCDNILFSFLHRRALIKYDCPMKFTSDW